MQYTSRTTTRLDFDAAVTAIRASLSEEGFGITTEIDLQSTFRGKLGDDSAARLGSYVILGACNPHLAERAVTADPSIGALLPCNVIVRRPAGTGTTIVEAINPDVMTKFTGAPEIAEIARHAQEALGRALDALASV